MSFAFGHRTAAGPRRGTSAPAPIALRARVLMRRGVLDRLLAAGADPCWDPELTLRAAQISAPRRRRALEKSLGQAVRDAHSPRRWTCAAPIARSAIRATAPELRALAAEVSREPAPPPQAIALTDQLVRDPGSPLYAPGNEGALRETVRIARSSLRDHTDPTRGDTLRPEGDDVGSRDFRFGATGLLLMIAIAVAVAILS